MRHQLTWIWKIERPINIYKKMSTYIYLVLYFPDKIIQPCLLEKNQIQRLFLKVQKQVH